MEVLCKAWDCCVSVDNEIVITYFVKYARSLNSEVSVNYYLECFPPIVES